MYNVYYIYIYIIPRVVVNMRSKTHGLESARQHFFFYLTIIQLLTIAQYCIPIRIMYDISVSNTVVNKTRSLSIIIMRSRKLFIRLTSLILHFCYTVVLLLTPPIHPRQTHRLRIFMRGFNPHDSRPFGEFLEHLPTS